MVQSCVDKRILLSGGSGLSASPGWGRCVVFLGTQVYKWIPAVVRGWGNLA